MIEQKTIILGNTKTAEFIVTGIFELRRLADEFGVPPSEIGHYPYELKYWVTEVTEQKYNLGSFGVSMDKKPKIEDYQKFPISQHLAQQDYNRSRLNELLYLLNILSDHYFFQYKIQQNWFKEIGDNNGSKWGQTMFSPNLELGEPIIYSSGNNDADKTLLQLTNEVTGEVYDATFSDFVEIYFAFEDGELKKLVHQAIKNFSKALAVQTIDWNATYLFFYSVLESLAEEEHKNIENKKCTDCGQMVYSVSKKLKSLLDKYCYQISNKDKNKLYEFRNKIVHKGKMLPFTNDHKWVMETQEDLEAFYYSSLSRQYFDWLKKITQLTIRSYIYQNLHLTKPNMY